MLLHLKIKYTKYEIVMDISILLYTNAEINIPVIISPIAINMYISALLMPKYSFNSLSIFFPP